MFISAILIIAPQISTGVAPRTPARARSRARSFDD
jgi:hypothetical protein